MRCALHNPRLVPTSPHSKGRDYKNVISASCWRLLLKTRLIALILASACLPQAVLEIEEHDDDRYEVPSPSGA
jgi:hypothetical protein